MYSLFKMLSFLFLLTLTSTIFADSIDHDGEARTFIVHLPPTYDASTLLPLVLILHRGDHSGAEMQALTGFDAIADRENFITVYPDGIDRSWNDGLGLEFLTTVKANTDDVGFITALLDELLATYAIDPERVYVTGFSSGANLSYLLACQHSDRFAAFALVGSLLLDKVAQACAPTDPVSLLLIQGTDDPVFAWAGGQFIINNTDYGYQYSAADTLNFWITYNQCTVLREIEALPDTDPADGTRVWHEAYRNCDAGATVEMYAVLDGGHNWSGVESDLDESLTLNGSNDFNASEVIWEFFARH